MQNGPTEKEQLEPAYFCNFCGNQRHQKGRCEGCGGASFKRVNENAFPGKIGADLIQQFIQTKKYLKILTAVVTIGFAALFIAIKNKEPLDNSAITQKRVASISPSTGSSTWGAKINPGKIAPESGFTAYYLRGGPDNVVYKESVDSIAIKYSSSDVFHNISPRSFGAYWVGKINVPKKRFFDLFVSGGHSRSQVFINGKAVVANSGRKKTVVELDKGEHIIEVEHRNQWHTADFSLSFRDTRPEYSKDAIHRKLSNHIKGGYEFLYVRQYESPSPNHTTLLNLERIGKPVVLLLDSYEAVNWHLLNRLDADVKAVVLGSYENGSGIEGDIAQDTLILNHSGRLIRDSRRKCQCYSGEIDCRGHSLVEFEEQVTAFGTGNLAGLTTNNATSTLGVPEVVVNVKEKEREENEYASQKQACQRAEPVATDRKRRLQAMPTRLKPPTPIPIKPSGDLKRLVRVGKSQE